VLSIGLRLLAVGVLVGLYLLNPAVAVVALAFVFGYVVVRRTGKHDSRQP